MTIAILASTAGSNLPAIFSCTKKNNISCILVTNKQDCGAVQKAKNNNIPCFFIDPKELSREEYDTKIVELLIQKNVSHVFLIGYMRIISSVFLQAFINRIYNIHPSLLPAFAGGMDADVHKAVIDAHCTKTGATLHHVTEEVDGGEIIMQKECNVAQDETPQSLKKKVQQLEQEMLCGYIEELKEEQR